MLDVKEHNDTLNDGGWMDAIHISVTKLTLLHNDAVWQHTSFIE